MRDGVKSQKRNPEVPVDLLRTSSLLNEQVFALKALTNLLKNAYQGLDVEWDMEEVFHGGESSGAGPIASSGDGSGEDDEDAESPPSVQATVSTVDGAHTQSPPSSSSTTKTTVLQSSQRPPSNAVHPPADGDENADNDDDDDNVVDNDDNVDNGDGTTDSSAGHKSKPTLQRALAAYLLPVVAVWFGGSFLEWIL